MADNEIVWSNWVPFKYQELGRPSSTEFEQAVKS